MPHPTCETCHFAERTPVQGDGVYRCHLGPPDWQGNFPGVLSGMWCGSHQPAPTNQLPAPHPEKITRPAKAQRMRG